MSESDPTDAMMLEKLGELASTIAKGKPQEVAAEELADVFILTLGNALTLKVDLEAEFYKKMDCIMTREAKRGNLGIRVTEYTGTNRLRRFEGLP